MFSLTVWGIWKLGTYLTWSLSQGIHNTNSSTTRKRAEIPVYSFAKHQRLDYTTSIYSPHVLILEGIFALYDPRVLDLLDMGVCVTFATITLSMKQLTRTRRFTVKLMQIPASLGEVSKNDQEDAMLQLLTYYIFQFFAMSVSVGETWKAVSSNGLGLWSPTSRRYVFFSNVSWGYFNHWFSTSSRKERWPILLSREASKIELLLVG